MIAQNAIDVRPFEIITGKGFINLVQYFVSIGARYGEVDVTTILPHPTTISRNVSDVKSKKHKELFPIIQKAIKNGECAATSEGWCDDYKKNNYLTMAVNFFDDNFVLQNKVLFTTLFNEKFNDLGFDVKDFGGIPMVTDRGGNMV